MSNDSPTGRAEDLVKIATRQIAAGEKHAASYDGDDRECIKTDVYNAFQAGVVWERRRAGTPPMVEAPEPVAWRVADSDAVTFQSRVAETWRSVGFDVFPLYAHPTERAGEAVQRPADDVQILRAALSAFMTHFGMDEDEWTKPTFDQARRALAAVAQAVQRPADGDRADAALRRELDDLLDEYWVCAHSEAEEDRTHDTEDGRAQKTLDAIHRLFDAALAETQRSQAQGARSDDPAGWASASELNFGGDDVTTLHEKNPGGDFVPLYRRGSADTEDAPDPCSVCGALIVPRNATHYDAEDLAAAQVRGRIISSQIRIEGADTEDALTDRPPPARLRDAVEVEVWTFLTCPLPPALFNGSGSGSGWFNGIAGLVNPTERPETKPEAVSGGRTGWGPGLLQDDCGKLARWFSTRLDARHVVRKVVAEIIAARK
jgi:hypothetical protein